MNVLVVQKVEHEMHRAALDVEIVLCVFYNYYNHIYYLFILSISSPSCLAMTL